MRMSHFFIDRPIFAGVIAVLITLVGSIAYFFLPVSQYPDIVPPTVTVSAVYPGASAETVADTVANPIEQEINGIDGMLYQSSESTGDGRMTITVTFKPGTDLDEAQVLVQNRVAIAEARLPEEVRRQGIVTRKTTPDFLMVVNLVSTDGSLDRAYMSNYAQTRIKDRLARLDGVGDVQLFGQRELAMRVWIDPGRAAALGLTGNDIVQALRAQNVQVAAGTLGQQPSPEAAFQLNVETQGRFTDPAQFGQVVVRTDQQGRQIRVNDVARVEIGAADYATSAYLSDLDSVILPVFQKPGSNALSAAEGVKAAMNEMSKSFPQGLEYRIVYNPTEFISQSIDAVLHTLVEAIVLVVLVIIVFLQKARASIIPVLAIPISLVGTFAVLAAAGYSLNNLSLFGLVLAIGIVVDDAIVVVENVERNLAAGFSPRDAARKSMNEVGEALIAIVLVLCAVFVPTLFMGGLTGEFYKQFAVTISAATVISLIASLTLSPALSAMLLRPHQAPRADAPRWKRLIDAAGTRFNTMFDRFSDRYARLTARLVAMPRRMMTVYAALIGLTALTLALTPTGFIPQQDQGYFQSVIQLPPGSATTRTDAVMKQVAERVLKVDGIKGAVMLSGFDGTTQTQSASSAAAYWVLDDFETRQAAGRDVDTIIAEAQKATADINEARLMIVKPPVIQGIGSAGGFRLMLQDTSGKGYRAMQEMANKIIAKANRQPGLAGVYTFFDTSTPRVKTEIDRDKAQMLGVAPSDIFDTLSIYLGSAFVNDFNLLGRTYRVTAQADAPYRADVSDIASLHARSGSGAMVPLGSVATFTDATGPYRVTRYNLAPAVAIDGDTAPGGSTGKSLLTMEKVAAETVSQGYATEWTGIAFQQANTGNTAIFVFGLAVLLVFLVLAAQYESLIAPLAIILIVPMCLLAAMVGVNLRGMDNNILTQIGLVVLIALSAKNAILIVEFARQGETLQGLSAAEAAIEAARTRLRPILMTSFAFILGAVPLVVATGAGAELRQALGTAVCFGMLGVTGFGLIFTPTFYVVTRTIGDRIAGLRNRSDGRRPGPALIEPAE
ncbi:hydrophobe/amphiphile efflux-1 (HAE1) family protein [Novosphingobium hassiacum]|uniref:Efflux pump membrane transporter n=1 Tax=Novosphingobium hassiacum TaxID=173676 RepID=A0A7W6EVY5_9SPHN|nr:multidrug efflux RND transporter permease subunit [Novosphingobium hassiacum]MBB3860194.1 hydrophobe/amphiphile efflux-1 (HAE1) family protein [Novosphingobium hassiacum]